MEHGTVLIVDDEPDVRAVLHDLLQQGGHAVLEAEDARAARRIAECTPIDAALLDIGLPDGDGMALMRELTRLQETLHVILITGSASIETAVESMKQGAFDFLAKPFHSDRVISTVGRALDAATAKRRAQAPEPDVTQRYGLGALVGSSPTFERMVTLARRVAASEASTILIQGESGTGKDLVAQAIHFESARAKKPFLTITCTTLQETLLESELFGHERGAFTDAKALKRGLLELAAEGTAYLDEIGDMSLPLQGKVLHFLEHKRFRRVGGTEDLQVDVRVIAATHRNLEQAIREGRFREDLYYRLHVIPIQVPPLRERLDDVPLLVDHFVRVFNREFKKEIKRVSRSALEALAAYSWPGNVRELRNVMERAMLLVSGCEIGLEDLLIGAAPRAEEQIPLPPGGVRLEDLERSMVLQALQRTSWNRAAAARLLGCSRYQVRYFIKKFSLEPPA